MCWRSRAERARLRACAAYGPAGSSCTTRSHASTAWLELPLPGERRALVVERAGVLGVEAKHPRERLQRLRGAAVLEQGAAEGGERLELVRIGLEQPDRAPRSPRAATRAGRPGRRARAPRRCRSGADRARARRPRAPAPQLLPLLLQAAELVPDAHQRGVELQRGVERGERGGAIAQPGGHLGLEVQQIGPSRRERSAPRGCSRARRARRPPPGGPARGRPAPRRRRAPGAPARRRAARHRRPSRAPAARGSRRAWRRDRPGPRPGPRDSAPAPRRRARAWRRRRRAAPRRLRAVRPRAVARDTSASARSSSPLPM